MIRVLLVDDHASFRESLALLLEREPDIAVVGQAGSLAEARALLRRVDVAIVDLDLPDGHGADLVRELRAVNPDGMVLILTGSSSRADLARTVEAGAAGALHKSVGTGEILRAVRRLSAGEQLLSPEEIIGMLRLASRQREEERDAREALGRLTPREREVLQALAEGLNDKQMAQRLHISTKTVRAHMVSILAKLGVDSRLQALVFAVRHGFVEVR
jgi:DNA-binding NarL/FixJ family response regulator